MVQTQSATNPSQPIPIPLGFCRVIADVIRRILKDQEGDAAGTHTLTTTHEGARVGEQAQ